MLPPLPSTPAAGRLPSAPTACGSTCAGKVHARVGMVRRAVWHWRDSRVLLKVSCPRHTTMLVCTARRRCHVWVARGAHVCRKGRVQDWVKREKTAKIAKTWMENAPTLDPCDRLSAVPASRRPDLARARACAHGVLHAGVVGTSRGCVRRAEDRKMTCTKTPLVLSVSPTAAARVQHPTANVHAWHTHRCTSTHGHIGLGEAGGGKRRRAKE